MRYPNIEAERARTGKTVVDLCDDIGISKQTYYNWQRGNHEMPVCKLKQLSTVLNVPMDYLVEGSN